MRKICFISKHTTNRWKVAHELFTNFARALSLKASHKSKTHYNDDTSEESFSRKQKHFPYEYAGCSDIGKIARLITHHIKWNGPCATTLSTALVCLFPQRCEDEVGHMYINSRYKQPHLEWREVALSISLLLFRGRQFIMIIFPCLYFSGWPSFITHLCFLCWLVVSD